MVRNSIIISLLIVFGCCFPRLSREQYKRKLKPFTLQPNNNLEVFKKIDTLSAYKYLITKNNLHYYSILKFYNNNRVGDFTLFENISNNRETFNPINADLGIYMLKNDTLTIEWSMYRQGNANVFKHTYIYKNDTFFSNKSNQHIIKNKEIPKEWLQRWKPDW